GVTLPWSPRWRRAPWTPGRSFASMWPGRSRSIATEPLSRRPLDEKRAHRGGIVALPRFELLGVLRLQQAPAGIEHEQMRVALDRRIAAKEGVVVVVRRPVDLQPYIVRVAIFLEIRVGGEEPVHDVAP